MTTRSARLPGRDRSDVVAAEEGGAVLRGDVDRFERREAAVDQELEVALIAEAGEHRAVAGRIAAGQEQAARFDEGALERLLFSDERSEEAGAHPAERVARPRRSCALRRP